MLSSGYNYREYAVLYVDDEPQALKYFHRGFSHEFRIETATGAVEAWQMIQERGDRYGVLVTDQRMPGGMSGTDLMQQVQQRYPHIVRILVTGYSELDAAVEAVNLGGAFRYITKPWDHRDFRGVLLRAMEFCIAQRDRDRLLREKLHVLQQIGAIDRVRSLSILAASLQGRLRNPIAAVTAYLQQAPMPRRSGAAPLDMPRHGLDVRDWNRSAWTQVWCSIQHVTNELKGLGTPEQRVPLADLAGQAVDAVRANCAPSLLQLEARGCAAIIRAVPALFERMLGHLIQTVARLAAATTSITVRVEEEPNNAVIVKVASEGPSWTPAELAPLFSSAIPNASVTADANLDLLSSFFVAHHHEGTIKISPDTRTLQLTLAQFGVPPEEQIESARIGIEEFMANLEERDL